MTTKPILLEHLTNCPVVSTDQLAKWYDNASPLKRASEHLCELAKQKLIEGRRREIGKTKVWRLANKGRKLQEVKRHPVPLNSMKIDHYLAISDVWQELRQSDKFATNRWLVELRERMEGKDVYAPDAFFVYKGKPYLLEVQRTKISSERWGEKWAKASRFFDEGHYKKASFQFWEGKTIRPEVVVISTQNPTTIQAGTRFQFLLYKSITDFL